QIFPDCAQHRRLPGGGAKSHESDGHCLPERRGQGAGNRLHDCQRRGHLPQPARGRRQHHRGLHSAASSAVPHRQFAQRERGHRTQQLLLQPLSVQGSPAHLGAEMKTPTNIDKPVANILQYSEQFDNPVWVKNSQTGPPQASVTPENQLDPLNGMTADTISFPATGAGQWALLQQSFLDIATVAGKPFTFSIWLKAGGAQVVTLCIEDTSGHVAVATSVSVTTLWNRFVATGTFASSGLAGTPIVFFGTIGV